VNRIPLLVTEEIAPSLRLVSALEAGRGSGPPTALMFSRGRQPAAALLARVGVTPRSLSALTGATPEERLLGACIATRCTELIMWACPRGAAAIHALRHLENPPRVTYLLPRDGTSPWDEAIVVATRVGNLIHHFVSADPTTTRRLIDLGIPESRISADLHGTAQQPDPVVHTRVLVIHGVPGSAVRDTMRACADAGVPCSSATTAAVAGIALGVGGRPGHIVIDAAVTDAIGPLMTAVRRGWSVTVLGPQDSEGWPDCLMPCEPSELADRVAPLRSTQ
jgi:hypothetical protein